MNITPVSTPATPEAGRTAQDAPEATKQQIEAFARILYGKTPEGAEASASPADTEAPNDPENPESAVNTPPEPPKSGILAPSLSLIETPSAPSRLRIESDSPSSDEEFPATPDPAAPPNSEVKPRPSIPPPAFPFPETRIAPEPPRAEPFVPSPEPAPPASKPAPSVRASSQPLSEDRPPDSPAVPPQPVSRTIAPPPASQILAKIPAPSEPKKPVALDHSAEVAENDSAAPARSESTPRPPAENKPSMDPVNSLAAVGIVRPTAMPASGSLDTAPVDRDARFIPAQPSGPSQLSEAETARDGVPSQLAATGNPNVLKAAATGGSTAQFNLGTTAGSRQATGPNAVTAEQFLRYVAATIGSMKISEGAFLATIRPDILPDTILRVTSEAGFLRVTLASSSPESLGVLQATLPQLETLLFGSRRPNRRGSVEIVDRRHTWPDDFEEGESRDEELL